MDRGVPKIENGDGQHLQVAVIVSMFNRDITSGLEDGARQALRDAGVPDDQVVVCEVPGSFEVPQLAMSVARTGRYDALVCLGAIIKGETTHDQHLADAVTNGLMRVGQETGVAVGLGVITTNTLDQARVRSQPQERNRGYEAAAAAVALAAQLASSRDLP